MSKEAVEWGEEQDEPLEARPFKHLRDKKRIAGRVIEEMNAAEVVERLAMFGGDIYAFTASLGRINGTREIIISKALGILGKNGNEKYLYMWSDLLKQYQTTQMIIMQRKAIKHLRGMPKPDKESDLKDWVSYGNFWNKVDTGLDEKKNLGARAEQEKAAIRKSNMEELIENMKRGNK